MKQDIDSLRSYQLYTITTATNGRTVLKLISQYYSYQSFSTHGEACIVFQFDFTFEIKIRYVVRGLKGVKFKSKMSKPSQFSIYHTYDTFLCSDFFLCMLLGWMYHIHIISNSQRQQHYIAVVTGNTCTFQTLNSSINM